MKDKRDRFIDILRGIGIISIVIGHSSWVLPHTRFRIGPFVYSYHLMIFFFISGFCFKKEKAKDPWGYIGHRLKSLLPMYLLYSAVFILLHNRLIIWHVLPIDRAGYSGREKLTELLSSMIFQNTETMLSAFWFIPVLFFAAAVFALVFYYSGYVKHEWIARVIAFVCIGGCGLYLNAENINFLYHIQTSILAVPVMYVGYVVRQKRQYLDRFITWYGALVCAVVNYYVVTSKIGMIELSVNRIINPVLFYPITFSGIYFCLGLAKLLNRVKYIKDLFAVIGKNSFHIMALHFLAIKATDIAYGYIHHMDLSTVTKFPHQYELGIVYYVIGVGVPLIMVTVVQKVKIYIVNHLRRSGL